MAGFSVWREEISGMKFIGSQSNRAKTPSCIIVRDKETRLFYREWIRLRRAYGATGYEERQTKPGPGMSAPPGVLRVGPVDVVDLVDGVDLVDLVDLVEGEASGIGGEDFSRTRTRTTMRTIGRRCRLFAEASGAAVDQEHG